MQVGDWHDTFLGGAANTDTITVRFQTDSFVGKMVVHCHVLEHEDEGMMAVVNVLQPPKHWEGARETDPRCLASNLLDGQASASGSCVDISPQCPTWKANGQCEVSMHVCTLDASIRIDDGHLHEPNTRMVIVQTYAHMSSADLRRVVRPIRSRRTAH